MPPFDRREFGAALTPIEVVNDSRGLECRIGRQTSHGRSVPTLNAFYTCSFHWRVQSPACPNFRDEVVDDPSKPVFPVCRLPGFGPETFFSRKSKACGVDPVQRSTQEFQNRTIVTAIPGLADLRCSTMDDIPVDTPEHAVEKFALSLGKVRQWEQGAEDISPRLARVMVCNVEAIARSKYQSALSSEQVLAALDLANRYESWILECDHPQEW